MARTCGLALAWCALPATGQSPGGAPNEVILQVTARDAKGEPVTDLSRQDFQIFDEGKRQPIATFEATPANGLPPTTLILLDFLNANLANRDYEANVIERALEPLETGGSVYLYLLSIRGDLLAVHALPGPQPTTDRNRMGPPWTRRIRPILNQAMQAVFQLRPMDDRDGGVRTAASFQALSQLADTLTPIRGPKSFIWITAGVPNVLAYPYGCKDVSFSSRSGRYLAGRCGDKNCVITDQKCVDYTPFLRRFSSALNRSDTVFYSVEAIFDAIPSATRGTARDTLQQLAGLTGGRVDLSGDAGTAITQSLETARGRYRLTVPAPTANGKYHKLRVECIRKNVRIDAPRGYLADAPQ